jgi:oxygen-independent coproporphyrinogen-3 oxidase
VKHTLEHIYFHIPFCTSRCGYCSFYTEQFSLAGRENFLKLVEFEIAQTQLIYEINPKTIYFGGGTPSLLLPNQLKDLINLFPKQTEDCEITLECNPITLTETYLEELSQSGINRVSLGIQSMQDSNLRYLGRKHTPDLVKQVVLNLREKGFKNISGDLIYGIPNQTIAEIKQDIAEFIKLGLNHVSIYCLSLGKDAVLVKDLKLIPEDEIVAEMYQLICKELDKAGYKQYEISNFAQDDYLSRHNLAYWQNQDYLGVGAGAYGTLKNIRYNNNSFEEWSEDIKNNNLFPNKEELTEKDKMNEYIMLQLRLNSGLNTKQLKEKFNFDILLEKKEIITEFINSDLLEKKQERLYLTSKSRFISNYVISELMED